MIFLRNYPVSFLRQKIIENYIVDFYCSKANLVIEIDDSQHYQDENNYCSSYCWAVCQTYKLENFFNTFEASNIKSSLIVFRIFF